MLPALNLSNEQLRLLILEYVKFQDETRESCQMANLSPHLGTLAVKRGFANALPPGHSIMPMMYDIRMEHMSEWDVNRATNVIWDMIIEGIVRPGTGDGRQCDLPFFHLTDYGREKTKDTTTPYDPDGYLKRLKENIPKLDSAILVYLNESLKGFRIGCTLSSAICIGVASEKAFMLVLDAYADYLREPDRVAFRKKIENLSINPQFDVFKNKYEGSLKGELPREVKEGFHTSLYGIFELIRSQRNDAGHPSGKVVERETVYASIVAFPNHLKRMYGLIDWLDQNRQT